MRGITSCSCEAAIQTDGEDVNVNEQHAIPVSTPLHDHRNKFRTFSKDEGVIYASGTAGAEWTEAHEQRAGLSIDWPVHQFSGWRLYVRCR